MNTEQPFPNSPITEALVDIQCCLPSEIGFGRLEGIHPHVRELYPTKQEQIVLEGGYHVFSGRLPEVIPPKGGIVGYQFISIDEKRIMQARLDGFTFNQLKPYENWNLFITEAKRLWSHYREVVKPISINRIAIRFINRIEIPMPVKDLKDWLLTVPEISPSCPQDMSGFFLRIVLPDAARQNQIIITETIDSMPVNAPYVPIIFDIDVFRHDAFAPDDPEIWKAFDSLRESRNTIFFGSITQRTRDLFQ